MKDVADVFGNLSGKLFKPEIQGNRKVPVDSSDIDFAIVRFGKQAAGPCFAYGSGVEILAKGEVKALSDQVVRPMLALPRKPCITHGTRGFKFFFRGYQFVPSFHAMND